MNLPTVIVRLVDAQNNLDSAAYANCFSETAVVFDEGRTHKGKTGIHEWIASANKKYNAHMKPTGFSEQGATSVLTAEISGTFDGSPALLKYHFEMINGQIQSLKITG